MTLSDWPTAGADDAPRTGPETGEEAPAMRPALPILDDAARSPDPAVCPFFRFELDGDLVAPLHPPSDGNAARRSVARPQSSRQQELVCLKAAHADCPRYLRARWRSGHASGAARPRCRGRPSRPS
jgi:hypothetical protein